MPRTPRLDHVLCVSDLSELGDRAVDYAFAAAQPAGRVTLLHVLKTPPVPSPLVPHYGEKHASPEELDAREREATAHLTALAEPHAKQGDVAFEVRVVRHAKVAQAILDEAERLDVDAICLATSSRPGLKKMMLGSAAHDVLYQAGRPVLLVSSPLQA